MNEVQQFLANFAENYESFKDINEFFAGKQDLLSNPQHYDQVLKILKQLDASKHSLSYLWILYHLLSAKKAQKVIPFDVLNDHLTAFFLNFKFVQVQSMLNKVYQLAALYSEYLISGDNAIYGIKPLMTAIQTLCQDKEQLCPIHREFAKLCLKAKCYLHSLPVIDNPVTSFKKMTSAMDIISYFYYKGMLLTGLKRYKQAIESFLLVLSLPTQITHKVHTESYKKLILLSLITQSKTPSYPSYISQILKTRLESIFSNYSNLAQAYINKEDDLFLGIIEQNKNEFERDKNWGLIMKLQKQQERRRICELNNTYLTLNYKYTSNYQLIDSEMLTHVKTLENPVKIEATLFEMVNEGQIKAKIDAKQSMIAFIEQDDDKENEYLEVIEQLENQNKRIVQLMSMVESVNNNIKHSTEYIKKTMLGKGQGDDFDMQAQQMS